MDATLVLEYAAWAAVAVVKFVVTPSLMMATGHPWWVAWAVTAVGAAGGVWMVWHSGKRLFSWLEARVAGRAWKANVHARASTHCVAEKPFWVARALGGLRFDFSADCHHACGQIFPTPSLGHAALDACLRPVGAGLGCRIMVGQKCTSLMTRPTTIVGPNSGPAGWTKPPCAAVGLNWRWRLVGRRALWAFQVKWGSITWPTAPAKRPSSQARWRFLRPCAPEATECGC